MKKSKKKGKEHLNGKILFSVSLAIIILLGILIMTERKQVSKDQKVIEKKLTANFITGNVIDPVALKDLTKTDYEELKQKYGIESDFVIYIKDKDGNIIPVSENELCIGSSKAKVNGQRCSN